jgi:predicted N-acyltransferase
LGVARHVAHDEIELGNADFESHEPAVKSGLAQSNDYVIRVLEPRRWRSMLRLERPAGIAGQPQPLHAPRIPGRLHESGSATPTGWTPRFITLWQERPCRHELVAACALYLKDHSYGEYVFDWAWANAYQQHGLAYYPKAVVAVPFTPVPGARLLARDAEAGWHWCRRLLRLVRRGRSVVLAPAVSPDDDDAEACQQAGLMLRHTVQFHWKNIAPTLVASRCPPRGLDLLGAARRCVRPPRFDDLPPAA